MSDGDLWGALGRAASEAAKAGKELAGRAAAVARDQLPELQIGREQLRFPSGLLTGPIVPQPYKAEGTLTWHDGYMASCECPVACVVGSERGLRAQGTSPAAGHMLQAFVVQPACTSRSAVQARCQWHAPCSSMACSPPPQLWWQHRPQCTSSPAATVCCRYGAGWR